MAAKNAERHIDVQLNGSAATGSTAIYTSGGDGRNGHDPMEEELALSQFSGPLDDWPPSSKRGAIVRNGRDPREELALSQFSGPLDSWPPSLSKSSGDGRNGHDPTKEELALRQFSEPLSSWPPNSSGRAQKGNEASQEVHGPERGKASIADLRRAFPDVHVTFDDLLAEDDAIVVRMRWEGTHTAVYISMPSTNKHAE